MERSNSQLQVRRLGGCPPSVLESFPGGVGSGPRTEDSPGSGWAGSFPARDPLHGRPHQPPAPRGVARTSVAPTPPKTLI